MFQPSLSTTSKLTDRRRFPYAHVSYCPTAAPDHATTRTLVSYLEQGWILLRNSAVAFYDNGEIMRGRNAFAMRQAEVRQVGLESWKEPEVDKPSIPGSAPDTIRMRYRRSLDGRWYHCEVADSPSPRWWRSLHPMLLMSRCYARAVA